MEFEPHFGGWADVPFIIVSVLIGLSIGGLLSLMVIYQLIQHSVPVVETAQGTVLVSSN